MIRILVAFPLDPDVLDRLNEIPEFEISTRPGLTPEQLLDEVRSADALLCGGSPVVSAPVLAAASDLKLIVNSGAADAVDMEAAQRGRIEVRTIAGDGTVAVLKDFFNV